MKESEVGLPSNADRAALAKILTVVDGHKNCEAALDEIQRIAVQTLNEPTRPGDYFNALPQPMRQYVHDVETRADPAGDVAVIAFLKETVEALLARIRELESRDH